MRIIQLLLVDWIEFAACILNIRCEEGRGSDAGVEERFKQ